MRTVAIGIVVAPDPSRQIGGYPVIAGTSAVGMDTEVQQLEQDHCQGKAVLVFLLSLWNPSFPLKLGGQIINGELICGKAFTVALDTETVAVQHGEIQ